MESQAASKELCLHEPARTCCLSLVSKSANRLASCSFRVSQTYCAALSINGLLWERVLSTISFLLGAFSLFVVLPASLGDQKDLIAFDSAVTGQSLSLLPWRQRLLSLNLPSQTPAATTPPLGSEFMGGGTAGNLSSGQRRMGTAPGFISRAFSSSNG